MKYVFKNLMRDWSAEGAPERAASYGRILAELRVGRVSSRFHVW